MPYKTISCNEGTHVMLNGVEIAIRSDRASGLEFIAGHAAKRAEVSEALAAQLEAERDEARRQLEQAVAAEREACAKVAESARMIHGINSMDISCSRETARAISAAIRARSNDPH